MTRKEFSKARTLVDAMLKITRSGSATHAMATELQVLLKPPPTIGEIVLSLKSDNHTQRAALIGLSRQGYYNLIQGVARPNSMTTKRLADLTGLTEEVIRQAGP